MSRFKSAGWIGVGLLGVGLGIAGLAAHARGDDAATDWDAKRQKMVERGVDFLINKGQLDDGSFGKDTGPGFTALCLNALLRSGRTASDPAVAKGLKYIESFHQKDGGYYSPKRGVENYETSLVVMLFASLGKDYAQQQKEAEAYLKNLQWGAAGGPNAAEPSDVNFGGAGYGHHKRPDLSNTQFFLDALQAAGDGPYDPAVKNALAFVSRCQNLESEHNTTGIAAKNPDGGFYYTPAGDDPSEAGKTANGGAISYGSMTYAGLKSMIFAGLTKDDPRVKAAVEWIKKNYTLDANPGMPTGDVNNLPGVSKTQAGLYYYYQTFAKSLNALGEEEITDAKGEKHNWRHDLIDALAKRQKDNGSWVNANPRFVEGNPNLVTAYSLLALSYAKPKN